MAYRGGIQIRLSGDSKIQTFTVECITRVLAIASYVTCNFTLGAGCAFREDIQNTVSCDNLQMKKYKINDSYKHLQNDDAKLNMMTLPDSFYYPSC
jgi:hypothetical protein